MSSPTLIIGDGNWAVKSGSLLGYEYGELSGQFAPIPITGSRASIATYTDQSGLIVSASSGVLRVDYSTRTGSLLLEPQRTNLILWSEQFDNAFYFPFNLKEFGNGSVANTTATLDPLGTNSSDYIQEDTANNNHSLIAIFNGNISGSTYTWSVYAKAAQRTIINLINNAGGGGNANYNLTTGVASLNNGVSASMQSVGNGWYRCVLTYTSNTTGNHNVQIRLCDGSGNTTYTGTGNGGLYIFGAQLEAGAYATTYIPTGAATATRLTDTFNRANMVTNGYIGPSGSTWYVELRNNIVYTRDSAVVSYSIRDNVSTTSGNNLEIRCTSGSPQRLSIGKRISGVFTTLFLTTTDTVKIAIKWNGTSADVFVNGVKQVSATAYTTTLMEFLSADGGDVPKFIPSMLLYDYPLPDSELITLTTL